MDPVGCRVCIHEQRDPRSRREAGPASIAWRFGTAPLCRAVTATGSRGRTQPDHLCRIGSWATSSWTEGAFVARGVSCARGALARCASRSWARPRGMLLEGLHVASSRPFVVLPCAMHSRLPLKRVSPCRGQRPKPEVGQVGSFPSDRRLRVDERRSERTNPGVLVLIACSAKQSFGERPHTL